MRGKQYQWSLKIIHLKERNKQRKKNYNTIPKDLIGFKTSMQSLRRVQYCIFGCYNMIPHIQYKSTWALTNLGYETNAQTYAPSLLFAYTFWLHSNIYTCTNILTLMQMQNIHTSIFHAQMLPLPYMCTPIHANLKYTNSHIKHMHKNLKHET